jgi:hypothetical protein
MKTLKIKCPTGAWPKNLSGTVAIGVHALLNHDNHSVWIVFEVQQGIVASVQGHLAEGVHAPDQVVALKPDITVSATLAAWLLPSTKPDQFVEAVEKGQFSIEGDFRVFGRTSPALLRLAMTTEFWAHLDEVVKEIGSGD